MFFTILTRILVVSFLFFPRGRRRDESRFVEVYFGSSGDPVFNRLWARAAVGIHNHPTRRSKFWIGDSPVERSCWCERPVESARYLHPPAGDQGHNGSGYLGLEYSTDGNGQLHGRANRYGRCLRKCSYFGHCDNE